MREPKWLKKHPKSNYNTLEKGYKEAYDKIINNFGVYYYPIFNNSKSCYEVNVVKNSKISFSGRKAYICPNLEIENGYFFTEFKVNNLGKKFFISKEECENLVNKLNGGN